MGLDADRLLWIATEAYSTMRQEQEEKVQAEEDQGSNYPRQEEIPQLGADEDDNEPNSGDHNISAQEAQENAIKDMDPEVQMKVHRTADKILKQLGNLGSTPSKNEIYDWTIKTAIRSQERIDAFSKVGSVYKKMKPQFDVSMREMSKAVSEIGRTPTAKPKMQVKVETEKSETNLSQHGSERERLLALQPN